MTVTSTAYQSPLLSPSPASAPTSPQATVSGSSSSQSNSVDASKVKEAADKIESLINSDGWFEWADRGELTEASNILANLDAKTADAVVDELANRGKLDDFALEATDRAFVGPGLTPQNRQTLFANFAKQLDTDSLAKVTDAFREAGGLKNGGKYVKELTNGINTHTNQEVRSELAIKLANRADTTEDANMQLNDREQAAQLLGSLTDGHLRDTLQSLKKSGSLDGVLQASVKTELETHWYTNEVITTYDTSNFDNIMKNVASLNDPKIKADVFSAGVTAMQKVDSEDNIVFEYMRDGITGPDFNDEAATEMATSLTRVLNSDVNGVMDEMTYGKDTLNGKTMTAYAKQILEAGKTDELGQIYAKLQLGNNLNGDPTGRMETTGKASSGEETHPHAEALGHFVGSIYAASAQITKDQAKQAEYATAIIKSALTVVDKSKIGGPAVGTTASVTKEYVSIAMKAALVTQDLDSAQMWEKASIPIDPETDRQAIGSDAFSALTDRIDFIFRQNAGT